MKKIESFFFFFVPVAGKDDQRRIIQPGHDALDNRRRCGYRAVDSHPIAAPESVQPGSRVTDKQHHKQRVCHQRPVVPEHKQGFFDAETHCETVQLFADRKFIEEDDHHRGCGHNAYGCQQVMSQDHSTGKSGDQQDSSHNERPADIVHSFRNLLDRMIFVRQCFADPEQHVNNNAGGFITRLGITDEIVNNAQDQGG